MATLNITLPDAMMEFLDRKIGTGQFKDASVYLQLLIAEAMESPEAVFTDEEKARIDQMLLESMDSFDRGEYAPLHPGEFEELARRMIEKHQGKQAS
jgi:Arc/MetJ-type ribon-helix-helix transcriptional regulator